MVSSENMFDRRDFLFLWYKKSCKKWHGKRLSQGIRILDDIPLNTHVLQAILIIYIMNNSGYLFGPKTLNETRKSWTMNMYLTNDIYLCRDKFGRKFLHTLNLTSFWIKLNDIKSFEDVSKSLRYSSGGCPPCPPQNNVCIIVHLF